VTSEAFQRSLIACGNKCAAMIGIARINHVSFN
jgi:hypothetical protein